MAQDYSTFKTYILTLLWRQNDTDLSNNFDVLVQAANDELDALTRDWERRKKLATIAPETQDFDLTANVSDFQAIISLVNNTNDTYYKSSTKTFTQKPLSYIYERRAQNPGGPVLPYYNVDRSDGNRYLRLIGPFSASNPGDFTLHYRIGIPNYASADASWLEDEYLPLYQAVVAKYCGMFSKDKEMISDYKKMQAEAMEMFELDDKHNLQWGGSPGAMSPHRTVP